MDDTYEPFFFSLVNNYGLNVLLLTVYQIPSIDNEVICTWGRTADLC